MNKCLVGNICHMGKLESRAEGRFAGIMDKFSLEGRERQLVGAILVTVSAGAMADKAEIRVPTNSTGSSDLVLQVGCDANDKDLPVASTRVACEDITNPSVLEAVQQYVDRVGEQAFVVEDCKDHFVRIDGGRPTDESIADKKVCSKALRAARFAKSERLHAKNEETKQRLAAIQARIAEQDEEYKVLKAENDNLKAAIIASQ